MRACSIRRIIDALIVQVLWHRVGRKGATGPPTTIYNIREAKDPNEGFDADAERANAERQYLIKWQGRFSHINS